MFSYKIPTISTAVLDLSEKVLATQFPRVALIELLLLALCS